MKTSQKPAGIALRGNEDNVALVSFTYMDKVGIDRVAITADYRRLMNVNLIPTKVA